jgi:hypothetical protein
VAETVAFLVSPISFSFLATPPHNPLHSITPCSNEPLPSSLLRKSFEVNNIELIGGPQTAGSRMRFLQRVARLGWIALRLQHTHTRHSPASIESQTGAFSHHPSIYLAQWARYRPLTSHLGSVGPQLGPHPRQHNHCTINHLRPPDRAVGQTPHSSRQRLKLPRSAKQCRCRLARQERQFAQLQAAPPPLTTNHSPKTRAPTVFVVAPNASSLNPREPYARSPQLRLKLPPMIPPTQHDKDCRTFPV